MEIGEVERKKKGFRTVVQQMKLMYHNTDCKEKMKCDYSLRETTSFE